MTKKAIVVSAFFLTTSYAFSAINIVVDFQDIGAGGIGGSGLSASQQAIFEDAAVIWETAITGYQDGVTGPSSIIIDASAPAIDGAGGILGSAGPNAITSSGGFTLATAGAMEFDSADLVSLENSNELAAVILHEMGHVLGIGTLWGLNGLYSDGSGEYTGENALRYYQRDFDPDATFVPVEEETGSAGSDGGHWNTQSNDDPAGSGLVAINPNASYFGLSLDDELMTFSLSGSAFLSDVTLGSFEDMGYTVNLDVPNIFYWDAGDNSANGSIESADGVWDLTTSNWTSDDGSTNTNYSDESRVIFGDQGATVTISGTVKPATIIFDVDGYTITDGTIDREGDIAITVTNATDTATFNTSIEGSDSLIIDGLGTVANEGNISRQIDLQSGTLTNLGTGVISGDVDISSGAIFSSDASGLDDSVQVTNSGTMNLEASDTLGSYISSGGVINGAGTLTAATYNLSGGAEVNTAISGGDIVSSGTVDLNGITSVDSVNVQDGTLSISADELNVSSSVVNRGELNIQSGMTADSYDGQGGVLSGNGIVSTNSYSGGTLETYITGSDTLSLILDANGGDVTLGNNNILRLGVSSDVDLDLLSVYNLVNNSDSLSEGFESLDSSLLSGSGYKVVFDTSNGQLYVLAEGGVTSGSTENNTAVITGIIGASFDGSSSYTNVSGLSSDSASLLTNVTSRAGAVLGDAITLASEARELSPEVYGGVADYGIRNHLNLLNAGMDTVNVVRSGKTRVFGGIVSYNAESENSLDDADFNIESQGGYVGATYQITKATRAGVMGAAETGDLTGERLKLEGSGTMFGFFTESELNMPFHTGVQWGVLKTSLSISDFSHDGTRTAQGLTNSVNDISTGVLEAGISYRAELFNGERYKVTPFIGGHYIKSTTDSFTETNSVDASNTLSVDEYSKQMFILEYGLNGVWKPVSDSWGLLAGVKAEHNFGDDNTEIDAAFNSVGTNFTVTSPGFSKMSIEAKAGLFFNIYDKATFKLTAYQSSGDDYKHSHGANAHFEIEW